MQRYESCFRYFMTASCAFTYPGTIRESIVGPFPASRLLVTLFLSTAFATNGACAAHFATVDGYDAENVDGSPVNVASYPRYAFRDGYVYDVNGRWYHQHGNRWVVYRQAPGEFAYARR
jgi:hypothetical protein